MKKLLFIAVITVLSLNCWSQISIDSNGITFENNIALGTNLTPSNGVGFNLWKSYNTPSTYCGIKSKINIRDVVASFSAYSHIGVYGHLYYRLNNQSSTLNNVDEPAATTTTVFRAGVAGVAYSGIGVYGAIAMDIPVSLSGSYAGYFAGNVHTTGSSTSSSSFITSDERLSGNIRNLDYHTLAERIKNLRPVTYNYVENEEKLYVENETELENIHYGLVAQEVKEVFPELVKEDADGYMSVNYVELIPILVETCNQMSARIDELESELKQNKSRIASNDNFITVLYQNTPNPFNSNTLIEYEIPQNAKTAELYIYDVNGLQTDKYNITTFGKNSITISGNKLKAGIYLYSLVVDGNLIDTKRMILTK